MLAPFDAGALDRRRPDLIRRVLPLVEQFNARYFRLRTSGLEHLPPPSTPALFVGNHNGGIMGPDLFCTLATLWRARGPEAPLYALAHDFAMQQFTPLGRLLQMAGAMRATRTNAARALASGGSVLVYPGGDLEAYRHYSRRHEIVIVPRTGFIEVAREAQIPIVPIVAHGAHGSAIIFNEGEAIARRLGLARWGRLARFPLALALPWGFAPGPWLPYLPLPLPVTLRVLPAVMPTELAKGSALEAAQSIQTAMQNALDAMASRTL